ncbi:MAG: hypothetical protein COW42_14375 [Deltaproteobacteria bacterium CG17_big_fil_post_rev_8_21_14_2_50_63_7]|nr:MAG: hypothetical protein COW42_14375 [Deltaproteobacteria bacterium CG17_big_fil_post_rev_8_21_14_2_50_63_7]
MLTTWGRAVLETVDKWLVRLRGLLPVRRAERAIHAGRWGDAHEQLTSLVLGEGDEAFGPLRRLCLFCALKCGERERIVASLAHEESHWQRAPEAASLFVAELLEELLGAGDIAAAVALAEHLPHRLPELTGHFLAARVFAAQATALSEAGARGRLEHQHALERAQAAFRQAAELATSPRRAAWIRAHHATFLLQQSPSLRGEALALVSGLNPYLLLGPEALGYVWVQQHATRQLQRVRGLDLLQSSKMLATPTDPQRIALLVGWLNDVSIPLNPLEEDRLRGAIEVLFDESEQGKAVRFLEEVAAIAAGSSLGTEQWTSSVRAFLRGEDATQVSAPRTVTEFGLAVLGACRAGGEVSEAQRRTISEFYLQRLQVRPVDAHPLAVWLPTLLSKWSMIPEDERRLHRELMELYAARGRRPSYGFQALTRLAQQVGEERAGAYLGVRALREQQEGTFLSPAPLSSDLVGALVLRGARELVLNGEPRKARGLLSMYEATL